MRVNALRGSEGVEGNGEAGIHHAVQRQDEDRFHLSILT
jgi:hypothetical protein